MKLKITFPFAVFAGLALITGSTHGALLVYEGFDYTPVAGSGDPGAQGTSSEIILTGKGGSTESGLDGTWANARNNGDNMYLKSGSLQFGDLQTSGNHIGYRSNSNDDIYNRQFTSSVTTTIANTGAANGSLYFSFLFEKLQNNFGADHEGLAFMNGVLPAARWDNNNPGAIGRHGIAVAAVDGSNLQAVIYDGTAGTRTVSGSSIPITVVNGGSNTHISNSAVNFIVGEILFGQGAGGSHQFNLYYAPNTSIDLTDLGAYTLAASIDGDFDESTLNTLNLTRQVNVNYDEVRIGTTFDSVAAVIPEPSTALLGGLGALLLLRRRR